MEGRAIEPAQAQRLLLLEQRLGTIDVFLTLRVNGDEDFALGVIRELFAQPKRAVAPSYGIDVVPIVKHALKGRRRRLRADEVGTRSGQRFGWWSLPARA